LGNDISVLPITTCATWYTCQSLSRWVMREFHTIGYYMVILCWWLHVFSVETCDGWLSWLSYAYVGLMHSELYVGKILLYKVLIG